MDSAKSATKAGGRKRENGGGGGAVGAGAVLSLQRAAGNRAVAGLIAQRQPGDARPLDAGSGDRAMAADIDRIVAILQQQWVMDGDEATIVDLFRQRLDGDRQAARLGAEGTPSLDRFIHKCKVRTFTRSTARSAFVETTVNVWDTLHHELEGERLSAFRAVVDQSNGGKGGGRAGANSENAWATVGHQELIGAYGMLKGLSSGAAGVVDGATWALTSAANKVLPKDMALTRTDLGKQVKEGFDFGGKQLFGKDYSEGDLFLGMNAASIGETGGSIIWNLAMAGAAGGLDKGSKGAQALAGMDAMGKVKSLDEAATSFTDYLLAIRKKGKLGWSELSSDPQFWVECTKLGAAIGSLVSMGVIRDSDGAKRFLQIMEKVGLGLKAAQATAQISQLAGLWLMDDRPMAERKKAAGKIVMDLVSAAFDTVGSKAAAADAEARQQAKWHEQLDQLPGTLDLGPDAAAATGAGALELDHERKGIPSPEQQMDNLPNTYEFADDGSPPLELDRGGSSKMGVAEQLDSPTAGNLNHGMNPVLRGILENAPANWNPGSVERGYADVTTKKMYAVRAGGDKTHQVGRFVDALFDNEVDARAYAAKAAEDGRSAIKHRSSVPNYWADAANPDAPGARGNPVRYMHIIEVAPGVAHISGVPAPYKEPGRDVVLPGGGSQVELFAPSGALKLLGDPVPIPYLPDPGHESNFGRGTAMTSEHLPHAGYNKTRDR